MNMGPVNLRLQKIGFETTLVASCLQLGRNVWPLKRMVLKLFILYVSGDKFLNVLTWLRETIIELLRPCSSRARSTEA